MTAEEAWLPGFTAAQRTLEAGGVTMMSTTDYDVTASRLITTSRFTRGADEWQGTALHHVYTSAHIGYLLTDAGFTDIKRYGGTDDKPYALGDRRLLLTARRSM